MGTSMTLLSTALIAMSVSAGRKYDSSSSSSSSDDGGCDDYYEGYPNYDADGDRVYSIACVEEVWDYAPSGYNLINGEKITDTTNAGTWLYGNGRTRIGRRYVKAMFREYENNCFKTRKERGKKWAHLGLVGPVIRAIQGESIKIYFKNSCSRPYSMHPHGVEYDKQSEGAPYEDGTTEGDVIQPGDSYVYVWDAREGSVDKGASSKMWLYHSHVDEVKDIQAGLVGAIIITKPGYERSHSDLMPKDVTREYVTFFVMFDEGASWYIDENVARYLKFDSSDSEDDVDYLLHYDLNFIQSNFMHSINGYLFGNLEDLTCTGGEHVRWHTASFGDEKDGPHSPHWHGNVGVTSYEEHTDSLVLIGGTTKSITMNVDAYGKWLFHCHVHDHIDSGMVTTYTAEPIRSSSGDHTSDYSHSDSDYTKSDSGSDDSSSASSYSGSDSSSASDSSSHHSDDSDDSSKSYSQSKGSDSGSSSSSSSGSNQRGGYQKNWKRSGRS